MTSAGNAKGSSEEADGNDAKGSNSGAVTAGANETAPAEANKSSPSSGNAEPEADPEPETRTGTGTGAEDEEVEDAKGSSSPAFRLAGNAAKGAATAAEDEEDEEDEGKAAKGSWSSEPADDAAGKEAVKGSASGPAPPPPPVAPSEAAKGSVSEAAAAEGKAKAEAGKPAKGSPSLISAAVAAAAVEDTGTTPSGCLEVERAASGPGVGSREGGESKESSDGKASNPTNDERMPLLLLPLEVISRLRSGLSEVLVLTERAGSAGVKVRVGVVVGVRARAGASGSGLTVVDRRTGLLAASLTSDWAVVEEMVTAGAAIEREEEDEGEGEAEGEGTVASKEAKGSSDASIPRFPVPGPGPVCDPGPLSATSANGSSLLGNPNPDSNPGPDPKAESAPKDPSSSGIFFRSSLSFAASSNPSPRNTSPSWSWVRSGSRCWSAGKGSAA